MRPRPSSSRWRFLIAVAALFLIAGACDPPPVTGITCLAVLNDYTIIAPQQSGEFYVTADGGMTWAIYPVSDQWPDSQWPTAFFEYCGSADQYHPEQIAERTTWTLANPADPQIVYRFTTASSIDRSEDGGHTWKSDLNLSGAEARQWYYEKFEDFERNIHERRIGPIDAEFDLQTGNLIVSMAFEGVLVREPGGLWHAINIGPFKRYNMLNPVRTFPLISSEIQLAILFALMLLASLPLFAQLRYLAMPALVVLVGAVTIRMLANPLLRFDILLSPLSNAIFLSAITILIGLIALMGNRIGHHNQGLFIVTMLGWLLLPFASLARIGPPQPYEMRDILTFMAAEFIICFVCFVGYRYRPGTVIGLVLVIALAALAPTLALAPFVFWAIGVMPFYSGAATLSLIVCLLVLSVAGWVVRCRMSMQKT